MGCTIMTQVPTATTLYAVATLCPSSWTCSADKPSPWSSFTLGNCAHCFELISVIRDCAPQETRERHGVNSA